MKKVIVDASIAVKWVLNEHNSDIALALLKQWTETEVMLIAPTLLASEVTNILHRATRSGILPYEDIKLSLESAIFPSVSFDLLDKSLPDFFFNVIKYAYAFKLPATYDAHYLALAEREACEFWTADEKLYNSVKDRLPWVRLMSEFAPASTTK